MENCLFVANLPQVLNNYELSIAMYLVFSRYGPISTVKASRDYAHRPFGFIEFISKEGCREAIEDFKRTGGLFIGGRRLRLELAKSTTKLLIKCLDASSFDEIMVEHDLKPIPTSRGNNEYLLKIDDRARGQELADKLALEHPEWSIQLKTDSDFGRFAPMNINGIAESSHRQSGLFQLRIPDSGVLPVSPTVLAKINYCSPGLQYAMTPIEPVIHSTTTAQSTSYLPNRLYEDWIGSDQQATFTDPAEARQALLQLDPPMGESACDVFIGRLDNQKVTVQELLKWLQSFGAVGFLRLCNRAIIREDRVPVDSTAYVRFASDLIAQKFIQQQNGATWMGRIIKCERCWNLNVLSRGNGTPVNQQIDPIIITNDNRSP